MPPPPQSGVDPLAGDVLGRLALSRRGLQRRNEAVFQCALAAAIPTVITFGGGYQRDRRVAVAAHADGQASTLSDETACSDRWSCLNGWGSLNSWLGLFSRAGDGLTSRVKEWAEAVGGWWVVFSKQ